MFQPDYFLMPPDPFPIPKLGQTRCYWTLLSSDLDFLYIDPVLRAHLGPQADPIIGRKLLEFVHPDEHASAHQDLGKVLESRTLHGSVTRVRYSRLGRVRGRLGHDGIHEKFNDEDKVSFDENYMACDLVINWAAEGLVLCFIHAVVDMSPQDNDEHRRTHWTNWCGTPRMTDEHAAALHHALAHIPPPRTHPPSRVFQILHNAPDRPALFSFPPAAADFQLATDVHIGGANGSDAKTSCTRRYKALQVLQGREVESIFIPHGQIVFACHKLGTGSEGEGRASYPLYPTPTQFYDQPQSQAQQTGYYPPSTEAYPPPAQQQQSYGHQYHPPPPPPLAGPSTPSPVPAAQRNTSPSAYANWTPSAGAPSSAPSYPPPSYPPSSSYASSSYPPSSTPTPASSYTPSSSYPSERMSPSYAVPPPRRRSSPSLSTQAGHPPSGVSRCSACKSTSSPEWRKGPSGRKDLCNACGLRFSRAKAKKEGIVVQRRRKDVNVGAGVAKSGGRNSRGRTGYESVERETSPAAAGEYSGNGMGSAYQYPGGGAYMGGGGSSSYVQNGYAPAAASSSSSAAAAAAAAAHPASSSAHSTATSSYERAHVS